VVRRLHPFNKLEKPRQIEPLHVPNDCPAQGNGLHHRVGGQGRVHCEGSARRSVPCFTVSCRYI